MNISFHSAVGEYRWGWAWCAAGAEVSGSVELVCCKDPLKDVMVCSVEFFFGFLGEAFVEVGAEGNRLVLEVMEEVEGLHPIGGRGMAVGVEDDIK